MTFPTKLQPLYSALNLLGILHLLFLWPSEGTATGFTTDLIPRDSPLSPFYNPSSTHFDRLHDSFQRSLKRINHFKSALAPKSKIQAPMMPSGGEYLMKISLGTPPVEVVGIADTGSDLTWTQCLPCIECYNQTPPLFDPHRSSSYKCIPCQSKSCNALEKPMCGQKSTCKYSYSYGDGSYTKGDLATETLTLGSSKSVSLPKIVFGCGHENGGTFDKLGSGIIGLGGGKLSLISQLGRSTGKKFSYCLAPTSTNSTSKISFGSDAVVSGSGVITTPIVTKSHDTFYYLSLEAFSVGNERIAYKGETKTVTDDVEGTIVIDSGTTLTLLPFKVFDDLVSSVDKVISAEKVNDPKGLFSLCYKSDSDNIKLPTITAHFKGGDVTLQPFNTFAWVEDDVVCFAMLSSPDFAIYGNLAQTNFEVGYDLEARTVSFQPTDCTKQHYVAWIM